MAEQQALIWERSLDVLAADIDAFAGRIEAAVKVGAQALATAMQEDAKNNAPWQDRTGDARDGLHAFTTVVGDLVSIYLAHGEITYDLILELGHGGRFAIIAPTLEAHLPRVWAAVREALV